MPIKSISWVWVIILALVGVDATWIAAIHLSIPPASLEACAAFEAFSLLLALIYTHLRPDERLAALTKNMAELVGYSISLGIFCYLMVTLRQPLIDDRLAAMDKAIGFNWYAIHAWVFSHTTVKDILICAYDSVVVQLGVLMTLMVSFRRYDRARLLLWLYIVSSLTYVVISGVLPAAGAFGYYQTALDTPYVQQFYAMRDGNMKTLDLFKLQGVVQFPSFHLALAVLCTYVTRGIRILFPLFVALNLTVIAATPAIGGHFFADLWTSLILISVLICLVERGLKAYPHKPS